MNTEQERAELLPCPFCGAGTTEIRENGRPWLGTKGWGEPVSVSVRHWCEHVDGQPSRMIERVGRDRAAAIDAWNRRAALQSQDREDAGRLDWLDASNKKHRMGWSVGVAPAGNVSITSVVTLRRDPTPIREAIDHARRAEGET